MKAYYSGFRVLFVSVVLLMATIWSQDADARKISGKGKSVAPISQTNAFPGDSPDHRMMLLSAFAEDETDDPLFGNIRVVLTEIQDIKGNKATVKGYRVHIHSNGDRSFASFEGTAVHTTPDGSQGTFKGTWLITGGTGQYAGKTGKGTYEGKIENNVVIYTWQGDYGE